MWYIAIAAAAHCAPTRTYTQNAAPKRAPKRNIEKQKRTADLGHERIVDGAAVDAHRPLQLCALDEGDPPRQRVEQGGLAGACCCVDLFVGM